jgi:putative ABC transport system permease protein
MILLLFLAEAAALAFLGGSLGLAVGLGTAGLLDLLVPALPIDTAWAYVAAAELIAVAIGLLAGVLPALRAARLDPVEALRAE